MSDESSSHVAPTDDELVRAADDRSASAPPPPSLAAEGSDDPQASEIRGGSHGQPAALAAGSVAPHPFDSQQTVISKRPPVSPPAFRRAANPFEMGQSLEGEKLGHFQLEEFVGGGGMGAVFRATDTMLGRTVAVKVVSREQTNEDTLRRFKNEAQSAARLDHPNIARVYYVGEDQGWNYIVFEYIEGINVRDLVEHNGVLTLEDAISYTLQMAEALEHASQREVTHRDIKPSNILIMIDGRAKLVDMGLARLQQVESSTDDLTASGVTLGTFDYISPEQARDPRNTDVRSDLYSLGCTLYFMLTGHPPFPDGTVLQKLLSHSSDEPPDLRQYRPDVDEEVARIVHKLLAKQPDQRFQSPRDLIGELLLVADRLNLSGIRANSTIWLPASEQKPTWWVRHLPWIIPVAVLLLFVLGGLWIDALPDPPISGVPKLAASVDQGTATLGSKPDAKRDAPIEPAADVPVAPTKSAAGKSDDDVAAAVDPATTPTTAPPSTTGAKPAVKPPTTEAPPATQEELKSQPQPETSPAGSDSAAAQTELPENGSLLNRSDRRSTDADPSEPSVVPSKPAASTGTKTRVVVTDEKMVQSQGVTAVGTLEEALQRAAQLPGDAEIELRFDGLRLLQPFAMDANRFTEHRIAIRAATGFSPAIAFRPLNDKPANTPSSMIEILGGHVSWQGTQFYFEVPDNADARQHWSLFRLDTIDRIEFRQCSFTIRSVDPQGQANGQRVSFVELVGPGDLGGLPFGGVSFTGDTPAIWLEDCIARGQAPFVRAEFALPFSFSWKNGLFVTTQRLFEIGGTIVEPRWEYGAIKIWLQQLLVVADQGIGLVRSDSVAPYQLGLSVTCDDCLFATQATFPATPLYTLQTNSSPTADMLPLVIGGSNNYYKNTKLALRVESNGDRNSIEEYTFDNLKNPQGQSWYNEKSPLPAPATMFSWTPPAQSVDRQSLHDFIPPGIADGWFTRALGIIPSLLPRLPDFDTLLFREKPASGTTPSRSQPGGPATDRPPTVNGEPAAPSPAAPSPLAQPQPAQPQPAQPTPAQPAPAGMPPEDIPPREMPPAKSVPREAAPSGSTPRSESTPGKTLSQGTPAPLSATARAGVGF